MTGPVTAESNKSNSASYVHSLDVLSEACNHDIYLELQLFFASFAAIAASNLEEVMDRARASRAVNDAKRAYNAKGVMKEGYFIFSKEEGTSENGIFKNWLSRFAKPVIDPVSNQPTGKFTPNKEAVPSYTQEEVDTMVGIHQRFLESGDEAKLSGGDKQTLDNLMAPTWNVDENGMAVISDEQMTIMLQQAQALYNNWINGTRTVTSAAMDLLRELVRALGG